MKIPSRLPRCLLLTLVAWVRITTPILAHEVAIPDPGLEAAIRAALHASAGPLTEEDLLGLTNLDASERNISSLDGLEAARNLVSLDLALNRLTDLSLPAGLTNLSTLTLAGNLLTNLVLPSNLTSLAQLFLSGNQLAALTLPEGLTSLVALDVTDNQLTRLTLPPDSQQLLELFAGGNPLSTLVLSEPLAATALSGVLDTFRTRGVSVFTYPLTVELVRLRQPLGAFQFAIAGPPGDYAVLTSTNLSTWTVSRTVANPVGRIVFTDATAHLFPQTFYRARLLPVLSQEP